MRSSADLTIIASLLASCALGCSTGGGGGPSPSTSVERGEVVAARRPAAASATNAEPRDHLAACRVLRTWSERVIASDGVDAEAQAAVGECIASAALLGMTRAEVEAILGPGRSIEGGFGGLDLGPEDLYFAVGRLPEGWVGGVPNLVVDLGDEGRCVRVLSVHTQ